MHLQQDTKEIATGKHTHIFYITDKQTVVLKILTAYVPIENFKEAMYQIEDFAEQNPVKKMILDKSPLRIFHQPSMEWYHVVWKENMYKKGLSVYRKILPDDKLFEESVKIGRERIIKENPGFNINKYDIQYCKNLQEALDLD
jgi:hypothetical protein